MPCYSPLTGYVSREPSKKGKYPIVFDVRKGWIDRRVDVPCGQCIGCRLEHSRQWAVRCVHEASLYDDNCFITLTYDDDHLPENGSLVKADYQKFMKRLRKRFGSGVRYFHCGEYGEKNGRPHHHACLFNFRFPDCERLDLAGRLADLPPLYISQSLSELWPFGLHTIGDVTFDSAAYVARYVTKKITGDRAASHYGDRVPEYTTMSRRPGIGRQWYEKFKSDCYPSDEVVTAVLAPEYVTMSRRPGIASGWFEKFGSDVYPGDFVVIRGRKMRPPRYYDNFLKLSSPLDFEEVHFERWKNAQLHLDNQSEERLNVRHEVQKARLRKLPRNLES